MRTFRARLSVLFYHLTGSTVILADEIFLADPEMVWVRFDRRKSADAWRTHMAIHMGRVGWVIVAYASDDESLCWNHHDRMVEV